MAIDPDGPGAGPTSLIMPRQIPDPKPVRAKKKPTQKLSVTAPPLIEGGKSVSASGAETETPEKRAKRVALERALAHRAASKVENARLAQERAELSPANPLFNLPDKERAKLFAWLRECPYDDAVQHMLKEMGLPHITPSQLTEFFQIEAEDHWEKRIERAALEANALVRLVEQNPVRFSSGILAALGQEAFRQIASGQVEPEAMNKMATLFLRARADERADQMQELKREKLRQEIAGRVNVALEKFAEEVNQHPSSRAIFEDLQRELQNSVGEA